MARDFLAAGNVLVEVLGRHVKEPATRGTYTEDELKLFAQFELGPQTIDREGALAALQANMAFPLCRSRQLLRHVGVTRQRQDAPSGCRR
jgi:hypothetical protein